MTYLRQFARFWGGFFFLLAIFFMLIALIFLFTGKIAQPIGLSWYQSAPFSLNQTQVITQRYLIPGIWDYIFVPILKISGWKGLPALTILCFVIGTILRKVPSRKRSFRGSFK